MPAITLARARSSSLVLLVCSIGFLPRAAASEYSLELSDLLFPGIGCGATPLGAGVSPRSGKSAPLEDHAGEGAVGAKFFATDGSGGKANLPAVDGVFSIDGKTRIDSAGSTYIFPATAGGATFDAVRRDLAAYDPDDFPIPIELNDLPWVDRKGLGLHANSGVTFDLVKIAAAIPGAALLRVEGVAGLAWSGLKGSVVIHVLLDGQKVYEGAFVASGACEAFSLPLPAGSRFLSFAATDLDLSPIDDLAAIADLRLVITGSYADCNGDGAPDLCDLALGESQDCDFDGRPDECEWKAVPFGSACPGSGGFVPKVSVHGCVAVNAALYAELSQAFGGAVGVLVIGPSAAQLALPNGCSVLVAPIASASLFVYGGAGFGAGVYTLFGTLPFGLTAYQSLCFQAFVADPWAKGGIAATSGVRIDTFETN